MGDNEQNNEGKQESGDASDSSADDHGQSGASEGGATPDHAGAEGSTDWKPHHKPHGYTGKWDSAMTAEQVNETTVKVRTSTNAIDSGFEDYEKVYGEDATANPTTTPTRLTLHTPTASSVINLGASTHHSYDGWGGTWEGITMGTLGTAGIAAGKKIIVVSAALKDKEKSTHAMADEAFEGAEKMVKGAETLGFFVGLAELGWFGQPSVGTALGAMMAVRAGSYLFGAKEEGGLTIAHGENEALLTSDKTVITAGGGKNVMIGGVLAEVTGGVLAEVKGAFAAGVTSLGAGELRAVGQVEVLSTCKAELAARQGVAEVLGKYVEIGSTAAADGGCSRTFTSPASRQADTQTVEIQATQAVALKAKVPASNSALELTPTALEVEAHHGDDHHGRMAFSSNEFVTNVGTAGLRASADKIELVVKAQGHAPHAAAPEDAELAKTTMTNWANGLEAGASTAATAMLAGGTVMAHDISWSEGLSLGAAAVFAIGKTVGTEMRMSAEQTYSHAKEHAMHTAVHDWWHHATGDNSEEPHVVVEANHVSAKVGTSSLDVHDGAIELKVDGAELRLVNKLVSTAAAQTRVQQAAAADAQARRALIAAKAELASKQAAEILSEKMTTYPGTPQELAREQGDALAELAAARDLATQCRDDAARAAQSLKDAKAALRLARKTHKSGAFIKVGTTALLVTDNGSVTINNAAGGWQLHAGGGAALNDCIDILP